jgi:Mg/Co/Ni transporter MgtE
VTHFQRLLREPPSTLLGSVLDPSIDPIRPDFTLRQVTYYLANYNLVAAPVVDELGRLVGAVTVDDVLDHMLPEDWRERADDRDDLLPDYRRERAADRDDLLTEHRREGADDRDD